MMGTNTRGANEAQELIEAHKQRHTDKDTLAETQRAKTQGEFQ